MKTKTFAQDSAPATPGVEFAPRCILVPLDYSELAKAALDRARQFARQFKSKLILVHAVEPMVQPAEYAILPAELSDINMRQVSASRARLAELQHDLESHGIECQLEVTLGRPWQVIVQSAAAYQCDLIIISTHGYGRLKHLLLGSTVERVVQHAPCSVLVVR